MLFQAEMGKQSPEHVQRTFWQQREGVDPEARDYAEVLFLAAQARAAEIDALIEKHTAHWRLERMAAVDRNILRAAVAEFLSHPEIAAPIIINESLEIARRYSAPESVHFINGVLDSIASEVTTPTHPAKDR